jgi:5'-3' exonuclease
MGVKGLYSYLKCYRREFYPALLNGMGYRYRIGIDAMSLLYRYKAEWKEIYPLLDTLKAQSHKLLFVFDGKPPAEKEEEVKERREARQEAAAQAAVLKAQLATPNPDLGDRERQILEYSVQRLEHQGWHMTRDIRHEFQRGLWDRGIPYVKALGEADTVLMDMVAAGCLDVIVSTDMDFLLSSIPRLWIPFRKGADGFEEILLEDVLKGEGISDPALRDVGILCGVEPLRGKVSLNPHTAFNWIRYYGSIEGLLRSTIREKQLECLRNPELLSAVRAHFQPQSPWHARIRPDHLERARKELEALETTPVK